ncbi:chaperone modulator CbpM [Chryseobacterium sp. T1]
MVARISVEEIISVYQVDNSFIEALIESELLHPEVEDTVQYIVHDDLLNLEKFINWHYDLEVNIAGIEIINKLLQQINQLRQASISMKK